MSSFVEKIESGLTSGDKWEYLIAVNNLFIRGDVGLLERFKPFIKKFNYVLCLSHHRVDAIIWALENGYPLRYYDMESIIMYGNIDLMNKAYSEKWNHESFKELSEKCRKSKSRETIEWMEHKGIYCEPTAEELIKNQIEKLERLIENIEDKDVRIAASYKLKKLSKVFDE